MKMNKKREKLDNAVTLLKLLSHPVRLSILCNLLHNGEMSVSEIKIFLHEEVRKAYDIKENQVEQARSGMMREAERYFILQQIDTLWREHLQAMDALRESIGLRGYGQKDPLIEYKQEGYEMFLEMMIDIRRNVVYSLFMFQPQGQPQVAEVTV